MEITELEAELIANEEEWLIRINAELPIDIPISVDDAVAVKSAFCQLIQLLRTGPHKIVLAEAGSNLFHEVATEYVEHLNQEMSALHDEMVELDFVDPNGEEE